MKIDSRLESQIKELDNDHIYASEDTPLKNDTKHLCANSIGMLNEKSTAVTVKYGGQFKKETVHREFLAYINLNTHF